MILQLIITTSISIAITAVLCLAMTGCTSSRFTLPPTVSQTQATPQQPGGERRDLGGPFTRTREDLEFPGGPNER
jgi:hypothetical protein